MEKEKLRIVESRHQQVHYNKNSTSLFILVKNTHVSIIYDTFFCCHSNTLSEHVNFFHWKIQFSRKCYPYSPDTISTKKNWERRVFHSQKLSYCADTVHILIQHDDEEHLKPFITSFKTFIENFIESKFKWKMYAHLLASNVPVEFYGEKETNKELKKLYKE